MGMQRRHLVGLLGAAIASLVLAPGAFAANAEVGANGNAFTGGLSYTPPSVDVNHGDTVTWTNTDFLVPHTVTEDHGLFNLTGTYGATPSNPAGFGPGEKRSRVFTAGTFHYFCEVHPVEMHGVVAAAMQLTSRPVTKTRRVKRKHGRKGQKRKRKVRVKTNEITAVWSRTALPADQVFDVQRQMAGGQWQTVLDGVSRLAGVFDGGKGGTKSSFRARVRRSTDPSSASGYSPVATITVG
jgi:plastocyanin